MKTVINTTTPDYGKRILAGALLGGGDGEIERMEAEGQASFVESEVLPANFIRPFSAGDFETLRNWGFVIGDVVEEDPLWIYATLPPGWERRATDHDMWSEIVDEKGRVRIMVFYKAAFYDRRASMELVSRLSIARGFQPEEGDGGEVAILVDGFKRLKSFGGRHLSYSERTSVHEEAGQWLRARFPECNSHSAYWEESFQDLVSIAEGGA